MNEPTDERVFIHTVDASGNISGVNDEWVDFAAENGAPELTREGVAGRAVWEFMEGKETRHISRLILEKVIKTGRTITLPYRCDSPDLRRFLEMEISKGEGGLVVFKSRILKIEKREHAGLLDTGAPRSEEMLTICSWCRRVRCPDGWAEVDDAVRTLGLFTMDTLPQITHGMCEDCSNLVASKVRS